MVPIISTFITYLSQIEMLVPHRKYMRNVRKVAYVPVNETLAIQ